MLLLCIQGSNTRNPLRSSVQIYSGDQQEILQVNKTFRVCFLASSAGAEYYRWLEHQSNIQFLTGSVFYAYEELQKQHYDNGAFRGKFKLYNLWGHCFLPLQGIGQVSGSML